METGATPRSLRRTITLPLLIFYGLGVTIGAGIFALIGEILKIAGDNAPLSFLLAGLIACTTGLSYALLVRVFPRAGGEAVYLNRSLGSLWGSLVRYVVAATGIISSAVIALAFAGYVQAVISVPEVVLVILVIASLTGIAWFGAKESVWFAITITILEVGTLAVVAIWGLSLLDDLPSVARTFVVQADEPVLAGIVSGSVIAFFAFIGFEDIVNMAEETVDPSRTASRAILWTLGISISIYVAIALVAVMAPDQQAVIASSAPMAELFQQVTGVSGAPVAFMAAIAMVNGILIQIVMASRMLYGMANEGLAPRWFASVGETHRTPSRATFAVAGMILLLALFFPLVRLAEATSLVFVSCVHIGKHFAFCFRSKSRRRFTQTLPVVGFVFCDFVRGSFDVSDLGWCIGRTLISKVRSSIIGLVHNCGSIVLSQTDKVSRAAPGKKGSKPTFGVAAIVSDFAACCMFMGQRDHVI